MIDFDPQNQTFLLHNEMTGYALRIVNGYPLHLYWKGSLKKLRNSRPPVFVPRSFAPYGDPKQRGFSLSTLPLEYPAYGNGDYRAPAYQVQMENGATVSDLRYQTHQIYAGKPKLDGLPATYVEDPQEAETLELSMRDQVSGLQAVLTYTIFRDYPAITRSVRFENRGSSPLRLQRALSLCIDFADDRFDLLSLHGTHNNERQLYRKPLRSERVVIDSVRGASSPQHDPFFALLRRKTDEKHGEIYGFSLVYSGNFSAQIEVDQYHTTRALLGINPFDFSWLLKPGESFQTPEVVLVYSNRGLGGMSHTYHRLYRRRLARGIYRDRLRPILINSWEANYFKENEKKVLALALEASRLGIELFVLDDGWFGRRDNDHSSLGDWTVNRKKFPHGLAWLSAQMHQIGLMFGLWFEPEMISPDSDLYRRHPGWCLHVPDRPCTLSRSQLVLDLSRAEVRDYLFQAISRVLSKAKIDYVKWDMNRHMTEIGSARLPAKRQRETAHRYMLGLYELLEQLTTAFPNILFESCSSGGGRFDPGMLYYMPQTWASDNTDAVCRLSIQYGTSIVYPPVAIGAHVSSSPNHQVGRMTSLAMRGHAAMSANFGYELDLTRLNDVEKGILHRQIIFYKQIRRMIQFGDFYRLRSPFTDKGNFVSWCFVAPDQSETVGFFFKVLVEPSPAPQIFRFRGLDRSARYQNVATGQIFGGDELMEAGLNVPEQKGDFQSYIWRFLKVSGKICTSPSGDI